MSTATKNLQALIQTTRPFCVEDVRKSHLLFWSSVLLEVVFLSLALSPIHGVLRAIFGAFAGFTFVRLFIFYHDFLHDAIFRDSPVMRWVMWAMGTFLMTPPNVWKRSHNYHHQKNAQIATASIGSFPVMTTSQYASAPWSQRLLYKFVRSPLNIALGYFTIFIIGMCVKSFVTDPKRHADSLLSLFVHALTIAAVWYFGGWSALVYGVFIPFAIAHALGAYLFYTQHNFPGVQLKPRTEWDYGFAALYSSSFMDGNRFVHWFTGNIGYHHVHHLNARIPFYRLPEAMAAIPELQNPIRTSLKPSDVYRGFKLKLWNPEKSTMEGFPTKAFRLAQKQIPA